jgi:hypothetical protein
MSCRDECLADGMSAVC